MTDLFAIACTTCKSRLKVRDASVIGQILACPKCSSMVLVEPPPGWSPPVGTAPAAPVQEKPGKPSAGESAVIKAAPKKAANAAAAQPAAKPKAADAKSLKETVSDSKFAEVQTLLDEKPPDAPKDLAAKAAVAEKAREKRRDTPAPPPPAEDGVVPAAPAAPLAPLPVSDRIKRMRLIGMLAVGGCMGTALAIGAAFLAASFAGQREKQVVENVPPTQPGPEETSTSNVPEETETKSSATDPTEEKSALPSNPATDTTDPPVTPTSPRDTAVPPSGDPLKLVEDPPAQATESDASSLDKLKEQFARLGPDAEGSSSSDTGSSSSPASLPAAPAEVSPAVASRPRPEPRKIDLPARLADRFLEIEFTGQPLGEVVQLLSDYSTIPITIEPEALIWAKGSIASQIKGKLTDVTVEEVLTEILKPMKLEPVKLEDQLVITRSSALRKIPLVVEDLTGGDVAKQKELIELIETLAAPGTWKSAGGEGTLTPQGKDLVVENNELAYGEALQLCERLRVARGGRTKSAFPTELFAIEPRTVRAYKKLSVPLTLNFGQPMPLVKILNRLGEETGTRILVDWRAAGAIGWPPDADATVTLEKTPLAEALVKLLQPMDLTYRVVDGVTLQVTTPAALESHAELEVYAIGDLAPGDDPGPLLDRFAASLGERATLRYDAPSKSLLALLSQPQHAQLLKLLASERAKP
jgi:DNA-directed RNA polymerase subunit RPC12/RpoP